MSESNPLPANAQGLPTDGGVSAVGSPVSMSETMAVPIAMDATPSITAQLSEPAPILTPGYVPNALSQPLAKLVEKLTPKAEVFNKPVTLAPVGALAPENLPGGTPMSETSQPLSNLLPDLKAAVAAAIKSHVASTKESVLHVAKNAANETEDVKMAVLASLSGHAIKVESQAAGLLKSMGIDPTVVEADITMVEKAAAPQVEKLVTSVANLTGFSPTKIEAEATRAAEAFHDDIKYDVSRIHMELAKLSETVHKVPHPGWIVAAMTLLMTGGGALGYFLKYLF